MFSVLKSRRCWLVLSLLTTVAVVGVVVLLALQPWQSHKKTFKHATVAANGYECAAIGRKILEKNGSAVDAAIATLFCDSFACAQCMGLGGGFLATIYDASSDTVRVLNARERAPAATTLNMFDGISSTVGGKAIAVPAELRGYGELHRAYGRLPWKELVLPTIQALDKGIQATEYMGRVLVSYSEMIKQEPSLREVYVNPKTGETYREGDLLKDPVYARTLAIIADEGPEAIHNGSLTAALVRDIQNIGGIVTEEDLRNYQPEWQDPITVSLTEGRTLYTTPLPGSGSVLAFILNMAREWLPTGTSLDKLTLYWHRVVEIFKFAYAKRTGLGDPAHSDVHFDIKNLERNLSDSNWAEAYRAKVDDSRTYNDYHHYEAMFGSTEDHGTAHAVVVAPDGSAVSVTSTVNYILGCQRRSQSLGIILNNQMDDFAIPNRSSSYGMPPSPANFPGANLQPLSSMAPAIVLDSNRKVKLVIGAAGGTKITTIVGLTTLSILEDYVDIGEAIDQPRLHHQLMPMAIEYEDGFNPEIIAEMQKKGHNVTKRGPHAGFAALVGAYIEPNGDLRPHTDPRRIGSSDGF